MINVINLIFTALIDYNIYYQAARCNAKSKTLQGFHTDSNFQHQSKLEAIHCQ